MTHSDLIIKIQALATEFRSHYFMSTDGIDILTDAEDCIENLEEDVREAGALIALRDTINELLANSDQYYFDTLPENCEEHVNTILEAKEKES
jgi:hypothetical protein